MSSESEVAIKDHRIQESEMLVTDEAISGVPLTANSPKESLRMS